VSTYPPPPATFIYIYARAYTRMHTYITYVDMQERAGIINVARLANEDDEDNDDDKDGDGICAHTNGRF